MPHSQQKHTYKSKVKVCSRQGAIQIHVYLYLHRERVCRSAVLCKLHCVIVLQTARENCTDKLHLHPASFIVRLKNTVRRYKKVQKTGVSPFFCAAAMQARISHEKDVRLSVRLSKAWIVAKRKKVLPRFLYHI